MPLEPAYRVQWEANHKLFLQLSVQDEFRDWAATVAFYTALHSIQQYLARKGEIRIKTHIHREQAMSRHRMALTSEILRHYSELENFSRDTRYECYDPTPEELQRMADKVAIIDRHIARLLGT